MARQVAQHTVANSSMGQVTARIADRQRIRTCFKEEWVDCSEPADSAGEINVVKQLLASVSFHINQPRARLEHLECFPQRSKQQIIDSNTMAARAMRGGDRLQECLRLPWRKIRNHRLRIAFEPRISGRMGSCQEAVAKPAFGLSVQLLRVGALEDVLGGSAVLSPEL